MSENFGTTPDFRAYGAQHLDEIPQLRALSADHRLRMKAVATVLPFRVNRYVVDELIDWSAAPDDPLFQLTFPQPGMLDESDVTHIIDLMRDGSPGPLHAAVRAIRDRLNPHPGAQMELNRPREDGEVIPGLQHKYQETVLFFPQQGQTCHSYCSYCFRWAQFVGIKDMKFAGASPRVLADYVRAHPAIRSVLVTGGDPMIMKTRLLRRYIEPLLDIEHLTSVRVGTKALGFWPHRFVLDDDADDLLRLFEEVGARQKSLALMAHYSHWRELDSRIAREAVRRVRSTGAVIRSQAPLVRHVNDDAAVWKQMWQTQVRLGVVPYYMFVERDTGPKKYFDLPLARAHEIYAGAYRNLSGLGRTARGPCMSSTPGKILVDGVTEVAGEKVFALKFLQARDPSWVQRPFFARYDAEATWMDQLRPAFNEREFFFEPALREMLSRARERSEPSTRISLDIADTDNVRVASG